FTERVIETALLRRAGGPVRQIETGEADRGEREEAAAERDHNPFRRMAFTQRVVSVTTETPPRRRPVEPCPCELVHADAGAPSDAAATERGEGLRQRFDGLEAIANVFRQRASDDGVECRWHLRTCRADRGSFVGNDR